MKFPIKPQTQASEKGRVRVNTFGVDNPNLPIVRFINLPRLFDLLVHRRLYFASVTSLMANDPYECSRRIDYDLDEHDHARLVAHAEELHEFAEPELRKFLPASVESRAYYRFRLNEMPVESLRRLVASLSTLKRASRLSCNCWHKGEHESDAMWRIYCHDNGVAIRSTVERLRNSLLRPEVQYPANDLRAIGLQGGIEAKFELAPVQYLADEQPVGEFYSERPWFVKRKAFMHEQELRLCVTNVHFVPVDLGQLIEEIVITPFLPPWAQSAIKDAIESVSSNNGGAKLRITASPHMSAPDEVSQMLRAEPEKLRNFAARLLKPSLGIRIRKQKA